MRILSIAAWAAAGFWLVAAPAGSSADTSTQQPTGSTSGRITGIVADTAAFAVLSHLFLRSSILARRTARPRSRSWPFSTPATPGKFKYVIGTSAGPNKHGVLEAKKVGNAYRAQAALTIDHIESGELKVHAIANGFPDSEAAVSKVYKCGVDGLKAN